MYGVVWIFSFKFLIGLRNIWGENLKFKGKFAILRLDVMGLGEEFEG